MIKKETLKHLRLPFSVFLIPVILFVWSQNPVKEAGNLGLAAIIYLLLVYPAGNVYGSYCKKDSDSIGGLLTPKVLDRRLPGIIIVLNAIAIGLSLIVSVAFCFQVVLFILALMIYHRFGAYVNQYPWIKSFWLAIVLGALLYWSFQTALHTDQELLAGLKSQWQAKVMCSAFLMAILPLVSICQKAPKQNKSIQFQLEFGLGVVFLSLFQYFSWDYFTIIEDKRGFWILELFLLPVVIYSIHWFYLANKKPNAISYDRSMRLSLLTTFCLILAFLCLILAQ